MVLSNCKSYDGNGYKQHKRDHTLFIKHSPLGGVTAFLLYVDDIIVTMDDNKERQYQVSTWLRNLRPRHLQLKYFLGIEIAHSRQGIFTSKKMYVTGLLKQAR